MKGVNTWVPVTERNIRAPIVCPRDNKTEYSAPNGKLFTIRCQTHTIGETTPGSFIKTVKEKKTLEECLDVCSTTTGCQR
jgi:hypothetical protein